MKRIILILLAALAVACAPTIEQELSSFLSTRASEPLKGTIWECQTGEQYNRYLYFDDANVNLFYGIVENNELQRWSPFYSAPYGLYDNEIHTSLSYPLWGQTEYSESAAVIKGEGFTINLNGDTYEYYGNKATEIAGQWMLIIANTIPWE